LISYQIKFDNKTFDKKGFTQSNIAYYETVGLEVEEIVPVESRSGEAEILQSI